LARVAVRPACTEVKRWDDGRVLWSQPLGDTVEARFGAPYYHLYRPDLLAVLGDALPGGLLRLARRLTSLEEGTDGVALRFADGESAHADVVIGADGIHSTVGESLFGPQPPPSSGGVVPVEPLASPPLPRRGYSWLGPDRHFVHYYVAAGRLLNFVAVCPA